MSEIMIALAGQLSTYLLKAEETAQARYRELREEILKEFARPNGKGKPEVFADPDFQFVIKDAHESFARSGEKPLREELVRLLIERSTYKSGSRTALILNAAIRASGSLTLEDISVLAVLFMMKAVTFTANSIDTIAPKYEFMLSPFVGSLSSEVHAFEYLESLGCITIERVADVWPLDENAHRRFAHLSPSEITKEELWDKLVHGSPSLRIVADLWPQAYYRHSTLTALGKALAHSALESKQVMDAPLTVWVK